MLVSFSLALSLCSGAPEDANDFRAAKILSDHCIRCHNAEKTRGGLDLSSRATALQGGATSVALVPGNADESGLLARATEGSMPPEKDGRRLTKEEIAVLALWISEGAAWPEDQTLPLSPPRGIRQNSDPRSSDSWRISRPQPAPSYRRFFRWRR